ncbi:DUF2971 domain-containing protein [Mycobacteroides chelonae]|uniref:DUF2971 domain-containing protein n=1 Tax=Mycobacteroides chelonae TaxID=1774 RepID=UPI0009941328|nr:DUF2971 domain-containing protein [Mycobacteroides chelonae]
MDAKNLMEFDDAMFVVCFTELADRISQWTHYGAMGRGFALGFDAERISSLQVPQYNRAPDGQLDGPVIATVGGGPQSGQQVDLGGYRLDQGIIDHREVRRGCAFLVIHLALHAFQFSPLQMARSGEIYRRKFLNPVV